MDEQRELSIRRATSSDLDAVASVWHESALSIDPLAADIPTRDALRHRIDLELRSGWDLYVALRGDCVVGMLAVKPDLSILDQIFVAPGEQGNGVGKALLEAAKGAMPGGFTLRMAASNQRARHFYEQQGMELVSEGIHPRTGVPVLFYSWNVR